VGWVGHLNHQEQHGSKFEIYSDASGQYRFRLKAANGEIVASSEAYESKASAKNGVASVRRTPPTPP
jgi:uncharacterized protein